MTTVGVGWKMGWVLLPLARPRSTASFQHRKEISVLCLLAKRMFGGVVEEASRRKYDENWKIARWAHTVRKSASALGYHEIHLAIEE